jgi:hypothetical protein
MSVESDRLAAFEEARLIASQARKYGEAVRPDFFAGFVAKTYPDTGYDRGHIAEMIKRAAILAGVKVAAEEPR